jgi:hypothetical protein
MRQSGNANVGGGAVGRGGHDADAACRGIGTAAVAGDARQGHATDVPVQRPVVRDAVRVAVADTMTYEVIAAARHPGRLGPTDDAVRAPTPELVRLLEHLRSTVVLYVCDRRAQGAPVERVLPEVKALVREAASCEPWYDPSETLLGQVVRWVIEAYFDEPELSHVPRFY